MTAIHDHRPIAVRLTDAYAAFRTDPTLYLLCRVVEVMRDAVSDKGYTNGYEDNITVDIPNGTVSVRVVARHDYRDAHRKQWMWTIGDIIAQSKCIAEACGWVRDLQSCTDYERGLVMQQLADLAAKSEALNMGHVFGTMLHDAAKLLASNALAAPRVDDCDELPF